LGPLIDFIASLGLPSIRVNTLTPEGRCLHLYQDIVLEYPHQVKEVLEVVEEKKQTYTGLKINCELGFYYNLPQSYDLHSQKNDPKEYKVKHLKDGCSAASTSCTITPCGDVIPCEGFSTFAGGNIREQDLLNIWHESENFKTIRELSKIAMDQVPYCKDCKYNFLCDGGCRASTYLINNDLLAPDILCPFWDRNGFIKKGAAPPTQDDTQPAEKSRDGERNCYF
jgi:radical SAM protein with 4Fe4S-binding SPASM domain